MENKALIGHGFIPDIITPEHYIFGSSQLVGTVICDNGDWRPFLLAGEWQRRAFDTYGCTIYNTLHSIETLESKKLNEKINHSERFIYVKSRTLPPGNSPHVIAECIRTFGLIPEELLPFTDAIQSLDDYKNPLFVTPYMQSEGNHWLANYSFGHDWVFTDEHYVKQKHERMKEALRYSPLGVSVCAWKESNGLYYKDEGDTDNHWTVCVGFDGDNPIIFDSYEPFIKRLDSNYDFGFAKRYVLDKTIPIIKKNESFANKLKLFFRDCVGI